MRVVFLIRSLQSGGAERQLVALARNLNPAEFSVTIVTYYVGGELAGELRDTPHVRVMSANKRGRWDVVGFLWRLRQLVRQAAPHVIHGYMYGANELALLLARTVHARVVWGVRASGLDMRHYDWATRLLYRTGAWLSPRADAIIANSEAGRRFHIGLGYPGQSFLVIPNGIDTDVYHSDREIRQRFRSEWSAADTEILIGLVARVDPMKDHETFLRAAAILVTGGAPVRFVVVGPASAMNLARLKRLTEELGIAQYVIWTGAQANMNAVYNAIDVMTSSSAFGEGFSNCLAEAMACEKICVATDVGDARAIVGDTGKIIPPREPEALAAAWREVLEATPEERAALGSRARVRIVGNFGIGSLATRTADVLRGVVENPITITSLS